MSILSHEFNQDVYKKQAKWREGDLNVTRSTQWSAPGCHDGCQLLFYTDDDGKLVKVEGDPNGPFNKGRLCMRCLDLVNMVNHADRIKYPMRRTGERGENKWERISWDEALDIITEKAKEFTEKYGPNSLGLSSCTARDANGPVPATGWAAFGTPMAPVCWFPGDSCYLARITAMNGICGQPMVADCAQMYEAGFEHPEYVLPEYMMIWGNNPLIANADGFFGHWVVDLMKRGTKLIVVDPEANWLATRAEYFIQLRPGTDGAIAMAMLNVITQEKLYNEEFCEKWVYGLEELTESVKDMTCEKAGEIAGVDPEVIRGAARAFATSKVSSVQWGLALDEIVHGVNAAHAIVSISAICGFIDVPGGNIFPTGSFELAAWEGMGFEYAPPIVQNRGPENWDNLPGFDTWAFRRTDLTPISQNVLEDLETDSPRRLRWLYVANNNPIANTSAEAPRMLEALKKIDFIVVADPFMTPTALLLADIVLPISMSCERESTHEWWAPLRSISKVSQFYEAKSDEELFLEFGKRMRPELFSKWPDTHALLDELLARRNANITYEELEEKVYQFTPFSYRKFETGKLRPDGQPGFNTTTGRLEVFSLAYQAGEIPPTPYYAEPRLSPVRTPELMDEYPFVLTTGRRSYEFFHSEHRQLERMREFHPDPIVRVNDEDAEALGLKSGDWVWIQNVYGKCKQKVLVTAAMKKGVVSAEHGWWFPERGGDDGTAFGVFESNINNCTTESDVGPSGYGCSYKTVICKLYKVTPENDHLELTPEEEAASRATREYPRPENIPY